MSRRASLSIVGVAVFLLCLIVLLPARVALRWLPGDAAPVGVSGTLWNGSAVSVPLGRVRLGETRWSLSLPSVLLGRLAGDIETRIGRVAVSGALSRSLGGAISCSNCKVEGPVGDLASLFPVLKMLDGRIDLQLEALDLRDNWPVRAVGTAKLIGVPIGFAGQAGAAPRADFNATLAADPVPEDGTLKIAVEDAGGPLQLVASIKVAKPGAYEFAGRAQARANASQELVGALNALGPKASDGSTEISAAGSF